MAGGGFCVQHINGHKLAVVILRYHNKGNTVIAVLKNGNGGFSKSPIGGGCFFGYAAKGIIGVNAFSVPTISPWKVFVDEDTSIPFWS